MNDIKRRGYEIARDSIRKEELVSTGPAAELVPEVLESLSVDKRYILQRIKDELKKPSANPVNAILGLFGLRIICTENTISTIDGQLERMVDVKVMDVSADETNDFLRLDEEALTKTTNAIAVQLKAVEDNSHQMLEFVRQENAALHAQLESRDSLYAQINTDFHDQLKTVAERVQYIMSLCGAERSGDVIDQLNELLMDLDLKAIWRDELEPGASPDAMFTRFKYTDVERRREKPCIMQNGKVLMKGVVFAGDEA